MIKEAEFKDPKYTKWLHDNKFCAVCGNYGIEVHHIREFKLVRKRNDLLAIPLCPEHHRGKFSPHGAKSKEFYEEYPLRWQTEQSILNYSQYHKEQN